MGPRALQDLRAANDAAFAREKALRDEVADLRAKLAAAERTAALREQHDADTLAMFTAACFRAEAAEAKLAAAEKERDFFDAERMKVVAQLEAAEAALAWCPVCVSFRPIIGGMLPLPAPRPQQRDHHDQGAADVPDGDPHREVADLDRK